MNKHFYCSKYFIFTSFFYLSTTLLSYSQKPNIILILADDLGYKYMSHISNMGYSTPNLDMMAKRGTSFTQCYASPICSPSRHMILTGKYNFRNYRRWGIMDLNNKTIANLLLRSGYATAVYGKWQLNGGDPFIQKFGFRNYAVMDPYSNSTVVMYKNPSIYEKSKLVDSTLTMGKYSEDIYTDSVLNFIDSNKNQPFFIYYAMPSPHGPFQPTPDDSTYATWNDANLSDTFYYRRMVKYMDKKIGLILNKLYSAGIQNNTYILFTADNGTPAGIADKINGERITGGKGYSNDAGTHVPLIVYGPNVLAGQVRNELVDFTDFMPTFAKLAKANIPAVYGTTDGVSFADKLTGNVDTSRKWIFNYYKPFYNSGSLKRWVFDGNYKLYDSLGTLIFYNIANDIKEKNPLTNSSLTQQQKGIRQKLKEVLDMYAKESPPVLKGNYVANITDTSAECGATILPIGGLTSVLERGTVYDFKIGIFGNLFNELPEGGNSVSSFNQVRYGLLPETLYSFCGYAVNDFGKGFSPKTDFRTLSKSVVKGSDSIVAYAGNNYINMSWNKATFPTIGASSGGYMVAYSTSLPELAGSPNGKALNKIITRGNLVANTSAVLQFALPETSTIINNLQPETEYNLLLVPYTWDGINDSTFNYFTQGLKRKKVITAAANYTVYPNPSSNDFTLKTRSNPAETVEISVTDVLGKIVFQRVAKGVQIFNFGKSFSAGIYIVNAIKKSGIETFKILKTQH